MNEMKNSEKNLELIIASNDDTRRHHHTSSTTGHDSAPSQPSSQNSILLTFLSQEKRQKFEQIFKELKFEKFRTNSKIIPEFLQFLPIRKTRAGLQFTCASPTIGTNDVWICNSDGFVGQISVLALNWTTNATLEPTVVSCNGVCNSRIICMTCVPQTQQMSSQSLTQTSDESDVSDSDCGDTPNDTIGSGRRHTESVSSSRSALCSPTMWFGTDDSSVHIYSCFDAIRIKKNKIKVALSAKVEAITYFCERVFVSLANQSVAIFETDPLTGNWNTVPVIREHVNCFRLCAVRAGQQLWTCGHSSNTMTVRDVDLTPLFDDIVVHDIHSTSTTPDDTIDAIEQMVVVDANDRVFVSTRNSLSIHLFSSLEPFTHLSNISIQTTLHRALISCEDIIRQHKSACLRISSLLSVKENVWIGTSAGIICILDSNQLELEIVPNGHTGHVRFLTSIESRIETNSNRNTNPNINPNINPNLNPNPNTINNRLRDEKRLIVISGGDGIELYQNRRGLGLGGVGGSGGLTSQQQTTPSLMTSSLVSGVGVVGSGQCENGREDSTNHLLLWQIS